MVSEGVHTGSDLGLWQDALLGLDALRVSRFLEASGCSRRSAASRTPSDALSSGI
jgi:hypothetical protein